MILVNWTLIDIYKTTEKGEVFRMFTSFRKRIVYELNKTYLRVFSLTIEDNVLYQVIQKQVLSLWELINPSKVWQE
jgi:hypothetical protein